MNLTFTCSRCGESMAAALETWRCPRCEGPFELDPHPLDPSAVLSGFGVWRYEAWLPVDHPIPLGEPATPLVDFDGLTLKLEGALPTGSFKDRGAAVLVAWLASMGAREVIEDSSGNAGAALAAYCARAGIKCRLFAPESAPLAKLAQIEAYGGQTVLVPGPRPEAERAAIEAADAGAIYASHAWNPLYLSGTETFAFELWEQLGREAPDAIALPVGSGALFLGVSRGFKALHEAGLVDHVPRMIACQAEACAPIVRAFETGSIEPVEVEPGLTLADGIVIPHPVRGTEILAAIDETGGSAVAIDEDELLAAYRKLAAEGMLVERTAAVAVAGVERPGVVKANEHVVVAATGNGLKTPPR